MKYFKNIYIKVCLVAVWLLMQSVVAGAFTLVIDPGHGGRDAGAVGRISKEKNINLAVALALGQMLQENMPDAKVIYTRKTDVFVELGERARIANKAKADLFISIHVNSTPAKVGPSGSETYTLGMHRAAENLAVAKRENAVITMENDYERRYEFDPSSSESYIIFEFMQDANMASSVSFAKAIQQQYKGTAGRASRGVYQAGFLVLRETSMPAVLTELGYINNPAEEQYLNTKQGQQSMARSLYNAIRQFRK